MRIDGKLHEWVPGNPIAAMGTKPPADGVYWSSLASPEEAPFVVAIEFSTKDAAIDFVNSLEN